MGLWGHFSGYRALGRCIGESLRTLHPKPQEEMPDKRVVACHVPSLPISGAYTTYILGPLKLLQIGNP